MGFLLRRIGFYIVAAWASITINFFLPRVMPGDPGDAIMARMQGQLRPEQVEAMTKAYGLSDDPLIIQYVDYIRDMLRGEMGVSISFFPAPVTQVIGTGLRWTILLGLTATILSFLIGSALGIFGAWRRGSMVDNVLPPLLVFFGSLPYFWVAILALYYLGFRFDLFPLRHAYSDTLSPNWSFTFFGSVITHLILPALTIVAVSVGGWLLGMRNTMIATLSEDYVTMAEAKGLPAGRVMFSYAARNALLPTLTSFGMSLGFILGGSLFTEMVFAYPGLGYLLIGSVRQLDYPLMQGLFLMLTFAVLLANLIVDILYVRLDPRVRGA